MKGTTNGVVTLFLQPIQKKKRKFTNQTLYSTTEVIVRKEMQKYIKKMSVSLKNCNNNKSQT